MSCYIITFVIKTLSIFLDVQKCNAENKINAAAFFLFVVVVVILLLFLVSLVYHRNISWFCMNMTCLHSNGYQRKTCAFKSFDAKVLKHFEYFLGTKLMLYFSHISSIHWNEIKLYREKRAPSSFATIWRHSSAFVLYMFLCKKFLLSFYFSLILFILMILFTDKKKTAIPNDIRISTHTLDDWAFILYCFALISHINASKLNDESESERET